MAKIQTNTLKDGRTTYRTYVWLNGATQPSPTFYSRAEIDLWIAETTVGRARLGSRYSLDRPRTPFETYAAMWTAARPNGPEVQQSRKKEAWALDLINAKFGSAQIGAMERMPIQTWFNQLADPEWPGKTYKRSSLETILNVFRQVMSSAAADGYLPAGSPIGRGLIKLPPESAEESFQVLDFGELEHLLEVTEGHFPGDYPFVLFLAETGCRISEAGAVKRYDYSSLGKWIWIKTSLKRNGSYIEGSTTKTGNKRQIPLSDRLKAALDSQLALHSYDLVFPGREGAPLQIDNWRARNWAAIVEKAGFPDLTPHDLRHTHGSQLLDAGVEDTIVAERLGHKSTRMIRTRYGHPISGRGLDAIAQLQARSASIRKREA